MQKFRVKIIRYGLVPLTLRVFNSWPDCVCVPSLIPRWWGGLGMRLVCTNIHLTIILLVWYNVEEQ